MTAVLIGLAVVAWVACGAYAGGIALGYFQKEFSSLVASDRGWGGTIPLVVLCVASGPFSLPAVLASDHRKWGTLFRPLSKLEAEGMETWKRFREYADKYFPGIRYQQALVQEAEGRFVLMPYRHQNRALLQALGERRVVALLTRDGQEDVTGIYSIRDERGAIPHAALQLIVASLRAEDA